MNMCYTRKKIMADMSTPRYMEIQKAKQMRVMGICMCFSIVFLPIGIPIAIVASKKIKRLRGGNHIKG